MMTPPLTTAQPNAWRVILVISSCALAFGIMVGWHVPLMALILEQRGVSPVVSGIQAAMPALAILISGPFLPRICRHFGALRSLVCGGLMSIGALLLFTLTDDLALWFLLRFLLGFGGALQWMVSETWINAVVEEKNRGKAVAVYATALGIGFAVGPQLVRLTGTEGTAPFLIGAAVLLVGLLPLVLARGLEPPMPEHTEAKALVKVARMVPTAILAGVISGFAESNMLSFLPIYAERLDFSRDMAVLALSVFTAGSIFLQVPLGWLADRMNRGHLLSLCALVCMTGALMVPFVADKPLILWPLLFTWGGITVGFYMLGLALIAQRASAADMSAANAAFIMAYTTGMMFGPVIGGSALEAWNPHGLMAVMAIVFMGYAAVTLVFGQNQRRERTE